MTENNNSKKNENMSYELGKQIANSFMPVGVAVTNVANPIGKFRLPKIDPIDDIVQIVNYVMTDQELEGREKGKKVAAKIFEPILGELKNKQSIIIDNMKKENNNFESKVEYLKKKYIEVDNEITLVNTQIASMRGISIKMDSLINGMSSYGIIATLANPLFSDMYVNIGIGGFLKNKMDKKREKYYQIELVNQSKTWECKIKEVKNSIIESLHDLRLQKKSNKEAIEELEKILEDKFKQYTEIKAQYNLLTLVR